MLKDLNRISTVGMTRDAWLTERRKGIGGSDAAAVIGMSEYVSPYALWLDKTGRLPDKPDTESMRQGRDLEAYVAERWGEDAGKKFHRVNAILRNPEYPFAHANVDRWVAGENAGLECKTTSTLDVRQFHGVEFPTRYYCQCMHYMMVTGAEKWYLAVLVLGREFVTFELPRNEQEIAALAAAERDFWALVETNTPPEIDESDSTSNALKTIYADSMNEAVDLTGRESVLAKYNDLIAVKKSIDSQIVEIENTIKSDMGAAERGEVGAWKISWKTQERKTLDTARLVRDFPDIQLDRYYKTAKSRPFKVTYKEEK